MKDDYAKKRRDELRAEKLCINGRAHGPSTHGDLCWPCRAVHRGLCKTRAEAPPEGTTKAMLDKVVTEGSHVEG